MLGQHVRFDGGHKKNATIISALGPIFKFIAFCPEVAIGMGVPRPTIRLVKHGRRIYAQGVKEKNLDVTHALSRYAKKVSSQPMVLSGYIFKKNSPSCGMQGVNVYNAKGIPVAHRAGIYANRLLELYPGLPCEEEDRLADPVVRENFIERVRLYHRWQTLCEGRISVKRLMEFHSAHQLLMLAHNDKVFKRLERLLARGGRSGARELAQAYIDILMQALKKPTTRVRPSNV